jgi:hypothetical protein
MPSKKSLFEKSDLDWVKISDLNVDHDYQRPIKLDLVQKIVDEFDPRAFGVAEISERTDSTLWILDAQQRVAAIRRMGLDDEIVPCLIHYGLTKDEEAGLFIKLNKNKGVSTYEKYHARVTALDPVAVDIEEIIRNRALKTGPSSASGVIAAVGSCEKIYRGYRSPVRSKCPDVLRKVLDIILTAWEPTKDALSGHMILGLGLVILHYNKRFDVERLKTKLKYHSYSSPSVLLAEAKSAAHLRKGSPADSLAMILVGIYNKGLRSGKLDPWRD